MSALAKPFTRGDVYFTPSYKCKLNTLDAYDTTVSMEIGENALDIDLKAPTICESTLDVTGTTTLGDLDVTTATIGTVVSQNYQATAIGTACTMDADGDWSVGRDCEVARNVECSGDVNALTGNVNALHLRGSDVEAADGTTALTLDNATGDVLANNDVTVTAQCNANIFEATTQVHSLLSVDADTSVGAGTTVTGGTGVVATTGNVTATAGNLVGQVCQVGDVETGTVSAADGTLACTVNNATGNCQFAGAVCTFNNTQTLSADIQTITDGTSTYVDTDTSLTEVQLRSESGLHPLRVGGKVRYLEWEVADISTILTGAINRYDHTFVLPQNAKLLTRDIIVEMGNVTLGGGAVTVNFDMTLGSAGGVIDLKNYASAAAHVAFASYAGAANNMQLGDLYGAVYRPNTEAGTANLVLSIYGYDAVPAPSNFGADITGGSLRVLIPYFDYTMIADC